MTSVASEGHASVMLEFDAGFNTDQALADVRVKVDAARAKLPAEAKEPTVNEIKAQWREYYLSHRTNQDVTYASTNTVSCRHAD